MKSNNRASAGVQKGELVTNCNLSSSLHQCAAPLPGRYTVFVKCIPERSTAVRVVGFIVVAVLLCASATGCRKPLLTSDEDRSQFHRYDRVRDQDDPSFLMDEFGRRRPNLRGRLITRD